MDSNNNNNYNYQQNNQQGYYDANQNGYYNNPQPPKKKHGSAFLVVILVLVLAFASGATGAYIMMKYYGGTTISTTTSSGSSISSSKDASGIAEKMSASVVAITTEEMTTGNYWFGSQVKSGAGSGVIMSSDGYIITCAHVVDGASSIKVTTKDDKTYTAKLVGSYTQGDIAVIKIEATGLTAATFADSSAILQGSSVYAVGNPEGEFSNSITSGIVSAKERTIKISLDDDSSSSSSQYSQYFGRTQSSYASLKVIQTDAAVSPGNSGGGLFDASGNLIGIVNAKSSASNSEGLGFAIPSNIALKIAKSLMKTGTYSAS